MLTYKAIGYVYGNYWGGGKGAYAARALNSDNEQDIIKQINKGIKDGSLDSGMGYESLIGAIMTIEIIDTQTINGKEYTRSEFKTDFHGNLTDDDIDFLSSIGE